MLVGKFLLVICVLWRGAAYASIFDDESSSPDYCLVDCNTGDEHVLCINKRCRVRQPCMELPPFTNKEIDELVRFHNLLRSKVALGDLPGQPSSSNMQSLSWDTELSQLAQCWVNYCPKTPRCSDVPKRFVVGQNFIRKRYLNNTLLTSIETYKSIFVEWFKQHVNYKYTSNYGNVPYNEYAQMVWSDSKMVGCARSYFPHDERSGTFIFLCNYGPAGRKSGHPVYAIGEPCSSCAEYDQCSNEYEGLCVQTSEQIMEELSSSQPFFTYKFHIFVLLVHIFVLHLL